MSEAMLIGLDWGTTHVRAALLDGAGAVLDQRNSESGVGVLDRAGFEDRFLELTGDWPNLPALAAGMIGSRQGIAEANYQVCPVRLSGLADQLTHMEIGNRRLSIIPGLKIQSRGRFDVMRGEETQLAGLISGEPEYSGTVVLPGSHSKWVAIDAGEVVNFQTFMTGEVYRAISQHTILRHSLAAGQSAELFDKVAPEVLGSNASLDGRLFGLRARALLNDDADAIRAGLELSAMLIGREFDAAREDGWDVRTVTLVGEDWLLHCYQIVAQVLGIETRFVSGSGLFWPALLWIARQGKVI